MALKQEVADIILNNDNDEAREVLDFCYKQRKTVINPIIDWEDSDVWEFIEENNLRYCCLYDEGFKRLGCIGCPMGGRKAQLKEFERWPKYKELYINAFEHCIRPQDRVNWTTAQDVYNWWIGETEGERDGK